MTCSVCSSELGDPIYESAEAASITTLNKIIEGRTRVFFCDGCGHLQTTELPDLEAYYAEEYAICDASEEDDQLYKVIDGESVYRADHQARVLLDKVELPSGARVLDYGCAKAPTLRKVLVGQRDIEPFVFDVTDRYVPFWKLFPKVPGWATHSTDPSWEGTMDVVLSFYALEHVADLIGAVTKIRDLLRDGGTFHFVVPNAYQNTADFVVADHINHFSPPSVRRLMARAGFDDVRVDTECHDAALVVTARRAAVVADAEVVEDVSPYRSQAEEMAEYWGSITERIAAFEAGLPDQGPIAIYGAGFYGNFLASALREADRVACVVDRNEFLHGSELNGAPVIPPEALPDEVRYMLVGLNPRIARDAIAGVEAWQGRALECFYL